MSERELREFVSHEVDCPMRYSHAPLDRCSCGLDKALADEPDMVKHLRWLKAQATWGEQHGSGTAGHWADFCEAMIDRVSKEFHVRLTDDGGWEWTE